MKLIVVMILLSLVSCLPTQAQKKLVGGGCDGCDLIYAGMPKQPGWETSLSDSAEPGEPMEINGTIYQLDGKTPAANVILYVYHTNAKGSYEPAQGQTAARRHGHLRGWMKTDGQGRYKFRSIKPAAYPGRTDPAHIHPVVKEPDKNEYYIDEFRFDDDPLLTKEERAKEEKRGGSGIIKLTRQNGVWIGHRDIVLGKNIPNYQ
ncbi:MAG: intradiol ring-cleavage dioxygenase [Acidobacteriota bacterium]